MARHTRHSHITAFEVKLRLWVTQLSNGQCLHFPRLTTCVPGDVDLESCADVISSLRFKLASHFAGVKELAADFKLFTASFDFLVDDARVEIQMELVELQCND